MAHLFALLAGFSLIFLPLLIIRAEPEKLSKALLVAWCALLLVATFCAAWLVLQSLLAGLAGVLLALLLRKPLLEQKHDFVVKEDQTEND